MVTPNQNDAQDHLFIVMDYVDSDLKKVLAQATDIDFGEEHALTIIYNALCSINYFHSTGLMHRDIKPANLLIDREF